jgi:hypothetical protein
MLSATARLPAVPPVAALLGAGALALGAGALAADIVDVACCCAAFKLLISVSMFLITFAVEPLSVTSTLCVVVFCVDITSPSINSVCIKKFLRQFYFKHDYNTGATTCQL